MFFYENHEVGKSSSYMHDIGPYTSKCITNVSVANHLTYRMFYERQRFQNLYSNKKGENAIKTLVVIHLDVCEPMSCMQERDFTTS